MKLEAIVGVSESVALAMEPDFAAKEDEVKCCLSGSRRAIGTTLQDHRACPPGQESEKVMKDKIGLYPDDVPSTWESMPLPKGRMPDALFELPRMDFSKLEVSAESLELFEAQAQQEKDKYR